MNCLTRPGFDSSVSDPFDLSLSRYIKTEEGDDGNRYYICRSGDNPDRILSLPSVSTVLKVGATREDASGLAQAKKKWDKEFTEGKKELSWEVNSEVARNRGTVIHEKVEAFFRGGGTKECKHFLTHEDSKDPQWENYNKSLDLLFNRSTGLNLIRSEFFVCTDRFAGRADLYIRNLRKKKVLVDLKTSGRSQSKFSWSKDSETGKAKKGYSPWFLRSASQLIAYSLALQEAGETPDDLSIWLLTPKGFDTFSILPREYKVALANWNRRLNLFWNNREDRNEGEGEGEE